MQESTANPPAERIILFEHGGETFLIRPICPGDTAAHAAFLARLSPEDMRLRFFIPTRVLPANQMTRMTGIDHEQEMAFIAIRETGETAGVARLIRDDKHSLNAEFAIVVDNGAKHKGVAAELMDAIIDWGKSRGVCCINGRILADNTAMLAFVRHFGFTLKHCPDEPNILEAKLICSPDRGEISGN
jgi:acetyltransferase